ncbi:tagaturonate reductase [Paenibacillus tarimensis]|uniref:tagaturonate reductase n=1 Tax=Paenibacillus tarimensis TaxID=416012 RepID=UPI001F3A54F9|nr:tagaturonate reductase [Paenibacillus tarimensis]MCF2944863.1 tagaturonate reductase [Paenibacillus tarimensis]
MSEQVLTKELLNAGQQELLPAVKDSPVTMLQIGEGNFLRGFVDWMIHEARKQGRYEGSIAVTQPRPSGSAKLAELAGQDGLYTLVTRGLENGRQVERKDVISVFSQVIDPYKDWERFLALAESAELQVVVSNTTEAGLVYRQEELKEGQPILSFPGKMAYFLYRRYEAFGGAPDKGLVFLPCELLERNGDELKACILRYCTDWQLPQAFIQWVTSCSRFLNSLVDRIVTGYPDEQAEQWFEEWGYRDAMLNTAEPYHFWAIEAEQELEGLLPLKTAGFNVVWTDDLKPYQQRKVRILNGAHTLMTPTAILHGFRYVREVMEDLEFGRYVREAVNEDIIPSMPMDRAELLDYAETVFERFSNPFIKHRLSDIAMNSVSKFKVRLLPSIAYYAEQGQPVPNRLARALAGLLRYVKVRQDGGGYVGRTLTGEIYEVRDDVQVLEQFAAVWKKTEEAGLPAAETARELLSLPVWGADLSSWPGLAEAVSRCLEEWS